MRTKREESKEEIFSVDTDDPIKARLPALIMEMRRAHEEIVEPKGWILPSILLLLPGIGACILLYLGFFKKETENRNIQYFARCGTIINLILMIVCVAGVFVFLYYGRDLYHALKGLLG